MTVTSNIYHGLVGWSNATYAVGARRGNAGNAYEVTSPGTSTSPPTGTGSSINNGGTAVWKYLSVANYVTVQDWADSIPSTVTQNYIGLMWNVGPIIPTLGASILVMSARSGVSQTNYILLRPATGEGFASKYIASPATPFEFSSSRGVAFVMPASGAGFVNYIRINCDYFILEGLQFQDPNSGSASTIISGSATGVQVRKCIIDGYAQTGGAFMVGYYGILTMTNNLIVDRGTDADISTIQVAVTGCVFVNNLFVDLGTGGGTIKSALNSENNSTIGAMINRNNIFLGYGTNQLSSTFETTFATDHSATTAASWGAAFQDNGNNITSLSGSATFVNPATDFHIKSGSAVRDTAVVDLVNIPSGDDTFATSRSAGSLSPWGDEWSDEWGSGVGGALPWDMGPHEFVSGFTVTRDFIIPATWNTSRRRDVQAPIDWKISIYRDTPIEFQYKKIIAQDYQLPVNTQSLLSVSAIIPIEWTTFINLVSRTVDIPLEWRGGLVRDVPVALETSSNVVVDQPVPLERGFQRFRDMTAYVATLSSLQRDDTSALDPGSLLQRDVIIPLELSLSFTLQSTSVFPVEWGQIRRRDISINIDWGTPTVTTDAEFSLDWKTTIFAETNPPVDPGAAYRVDVPVPLERLSMIQADAQFPVGPNGGVFRDVEIPADSKATPQYVQSSELEWGLSVRAEAAVPVEYGGRTFGGIAVTVPLEWRSSIYTDVEMSGPEWRLSVMVDQALPVSTVAAVRMDANVNLEISSNLELEVIFPLDYSHELLFREMLAVFPLEYLATVQVDVTFGSMTELGQKAIGSKIEPDEWEEEHAG
jgi:hypothetical protein